MSTRAAIVALWCLGGLWALFFQAFWRLAPRFLEVVADLGPWEWAAFAAWLAFMLYTEGYRGFQLKFSPRFAARAMHLAREGTPLQLALGPLFAMALFHTTRRRLIASWLLVAMIVCFVVALQYCPQPWRGIVDGGVVLGLVYGGLTTTWFTMAALAGRPLADPELPV